MPDVPGSVVDIRPQIRAHQVDRAIATLADRQYGVVARRQLGAIGVSASAVKVRVAGGRLVRLHRGVYAVGHRRLRREGHWLAAVLAAGPGAVLSHRDAAALHGLGQANGRRIDVTTMAERRGLPGIRVHHARRLEAADVTVVDGVPVTSVARTLVDLAHVVRPDSLAKALRAAEQLQVLDVRAIEHAMQRTSRRRGPGHKAMKQALAELQALATSLTRSPLEAAFLKLLGNASLPRPETNVLVEGLQVDALWRDHRLVVELDGWRDHHTKHAFQHDRERDAILQAAGHRVLRFTHRDVAHRPAHVADTLRRLGVR